MVPLVDLLVDLLVVEAVTFQEITDEVREKIRDHLVMTEDRVEAFHPEKHQEQEDQHKANHAPPEPLLASERALRKIE